MANKKNNKTKKTKNNIKVIKKPIKKETKKIENNKLDGEILSFIKIALGVGVVVLIVFGATILMNKLGVFDEGYTKPERGEIIISYEDATVGTIFNRPDTEYYVVFDDFTENPNQYLTSILFRYSNEEETLPIYKVDMSNGFNIKYAALPIYKVDISNGFNIKYAGEQGNPSAQKVEDIKINGVTLIKIVNGKNVKYIEGTTNIENELLK